MEICMFVRLLFIVCLLCPGVAHAQIMLQGGVTTPIWSQPNANEVDTAAQSGGQAGGRELGRNYQLETLRCPSGSAIVGMQISRGDVLDSLEIACAVPQCKADDCHWSSAGIQWGQEAGNPQGGDMQQPMLCAQNSALTGFTARVVTFTQFDYAADIAPECGLLASAASPDGFFAVTVTSSAARAGPSVESSYTPPNATASIVGPVSCAPNGAASAVSTATADFVNPGQRVVQAVSFYCPAKPVPHSPLCKIGGSLSDNAKGAVTMQQFIAYLRSDGGGIGSSWNAVTSGNYKTLKNADGSVSDYRYVQTPQDPNVIIDMRHFQYVGPLGVGVGEVIEACQSNMHEASAYQRQDFYSNALGQAFASYRDATGNGDYATALQNFFLGNLIFVGQNGQNTSNAQLINKIIQSANSMQ
jgi:hypothetical protein